MDAVITVVTRNYLHFALNLFDSVGRSDPTVQRYLFVADGAPESMTGNLDGVEVVSCQTLAIDGWERMTFQYTPFELACALKPFAMRYALERGANRVIYLDADIHVYDSLSPIYDQLEQTPVRLTPHWVSESDASCDLEEMKTILRAGIYNAGFLALRKSETAQHFLDWWQRVCRTECYVDLESGVFVDQAWLNLVPQLFENVGIELGAPYNVAHWNVQRRQLQRQGARWLVGTSSKPLCFFHFSGVDLNDSSRLSKHHRLQGPLNPAVRELVREYANHVQRFDPVRFASLGCAFDCLPDGTPVHPRWREAIRADFESLRDIDNPWDLNCHPDLVQRLRAEELRSIEQRVGWEQERKREQKFSRKLKRFWQAWGRPRRDGKSAA